MTEKNDVCVLARAHETNLADRRGERPHQNPLDGVTGVRSVIVDQGEIMSLNREPDVITFGTVTIPTDRKSSPAERDAAAEAAYLNWRRRRK